MSGWIKLYRSLKDWEWYDDHNATRVLIHLLVSVNYEDKKWRGEDIKAGSMVLSYDSLSREVGLSVQQVRTALSKLESSKQITRKATSKYQVVTLCKWAKLQDESEKVTSKQQAVKQSSNNQVTTTKEYKELKEEKRVLLDAWITYRKQLKKPLTQNSIVTLCKKLEGISVETAKAVIDKSIENGWQGLFWDKVEESNQLPKLDRMVAHTALQAGGSILQKHLDKGYTVEQLKQFANQ